MTQTNVASPASQATATETVAFYLDPACPWCWRTSMWIREVQKVRPVAIDWKFFSLEEVNKAEGATVDWENGRSAPALRVLALVRRKLGNEAVDRFYHALGQARFVNEKQYKDEGVVEDALRAAGLDPALKAEALADQSTADEILGEHKEIVGRVGAFGVPTLVLDDDKGPAMFGPVISSIPEGEDAGEMWDHTLWFTRRNDFFELKRSRPPARH